MVMTHKIFILVLFAILSISFQSSWATSISISTGKQVYEYGDFLSVNLQVSEITGDSIVLHIIDSSGQSSSPIPIQISKLNSTIIAPGAFYITNYPPGKYQIIGEYSGVKSSTSFELIDSGKIAIPPQYKVLVKSWLQGTPTQKDYAGLIRDLINFNIIKVSDYHAQKTIYIPHWLQVNAKLWSYDSISDNEFGSALQYLAQKGIISV